MRSLNLPKEYLNRIVDSIVSAVPTECVYVFGSYARGDETSQSDIDLFVITSDDSELPTEYGKRIRMALPWINAWSDPALPKGKDIVCSSRKAFNENAANILSLAYIVNHEGVKIYG